MEKIVLGGGCFWCTEAVFDLIDGVTEVVPGYAGGFTGEPTYEEVCGGSTGHAEVVSVTFEPSKVSFEDLLELFFATHDPTTPDRQGNDVGTQYRSIILYETDEAKAKIESYIEGIRGDFSRPVVTQVHRLGAFYPAEEYHNRYFERNPHRPYCSMVVSPKVKKARAKLGLD